MKVEAFSRKDEINGAIYPLYRIVKYSTVFYMFILPKFALFKLNINRGVPSYLFML